MLTSKFSIFVSYLSRFSLGSTFIRPTLTFVPKFDVSHLYYMLISHLWQQVVAMLWWLMDDVQFDIFNNFWRRFPSSWLCDTYWACFSMRSGNWSYSLVCCIFAGVILFLVSGHNMNLSLLTQYKRYLTEMQSKCVSTSCWYVLKRMIKSTRSTILNRFGSCSLGCFSMIVNLQKDCASVPHVDLKMQLVLNLQHCGFAFAEKC